MQPDTVAAWTEALVKAPRVEAASATLRTLTGVWRNDERGEVRRTRLTGDTLFTDGEPPIAYVPLGGDRFRLERATEVRFEGGASRMVVRTPVSTATYTRTDTVALDAAKLAEYVGDYRNDEAEVTHTWKIEKGKLAVYAGYRLLGILEPSYRDGFTRGGAVVNVTRDGKGRITGYQVEAGRIRRLKFTRIRQP
jgi:hypothetical protein